MVHGIIEDCNESFEQLQIEPKALFLMGVLDDNPEPAQLAKTLLLPKPTITFLIKRLEEEGYVKRANDRADLRKYKISLTKSGRKAMEAGREALTKSLDTRLKKLSEQQRCELYQSIAELQSCSH
jgi:DNA-binding MarR family transcriptional regulator